MREVRVFLPFVASTSPSVTKDTVISDITTVLRDMNVRSAFNAVIVHVKEVSCILSTAYRAATDALKEPYISDDAPVYFATTMKMRPREHAGACVSRMKPTQVKQLIASYFDGARTPGALESVIRDFQLEK